MLKKEARKLFKEKRESISGSQKLKFDDLILIQFQKLDLPFIDNAMSFYSMEEKNEVNSFIITEYLLFKNPSLQLVYPRMIESEINLEAVICNADSAFAENEFGITEPIGNDIISPSELEVVLVPLLAIDIHGNRVGYGKGYYERFLKQCSEHCIKIGLSYFEPIDNIDDANEFDVPLDLCITPEQVYVF